MLALKLEDIYSQQARENMGTRTDLGRNLSQGEGGRSAEKAAKDMNISRQTVTFAKNVVNRGIPKLIKMVESGEVAVSTAAKVAFQSNDVQEEIVGRAESQIGEGKKPKIISLLREIAPPAQETPEDISKRLKRNLEANWGLLQSIETEQRPENLAEMLKIADRIAARLREIASRTSSPS
jgi:DNA-binding XRE family transcriptional regulator